MMCVIESGDGYLQLKEISCFGTLKQRLITYFLICLGEDEKKCTKSFARKF
jgi:hypothetical protein